MPRIEEQPPTPVLPLFTPENSKDREIRERSTSRPRSRAVSGRVEGRARDICEGARERGRSFLGDKSSVITEEREEREQLDKRERKRKQLDREEKDKRVQERLKQDPKKLSNEKLAEMGISDMSKKGQWIFYAITSGACAAANGVFAKL